MPERFGRQLAVKRRINAKVHSSGVRTVRKWLGDFFARLEHVVDHGCDDR